MAALPYNAANKVLAETEHRFWESDDRIFGGGTYTDLPTEFTYYPSDNAKAKDPRISAGPGVLLASYTIGHAALRYAAQSPTVAAGSAISALTAVHPQLSKPSMVRKAVSWSWDNHPWSRGGFCGASQANGPQCSACRRWRAGSILRESTSRSIEPGYRGLLNRLW